MYSKKNQKAVKCTHGGVLLIGEHIYGHTEPGAWVCQDFEKGDVSWTERDQLNCKSGSITSAEGLLYLYSDEGDVGLVEADPKAFKLISSFKVPETSQYPAMRQTSKQAKVWSHPVIANGHLFLRDAEFIYCYDIRAAK
jgi:outer membrane protein assembly factor BamB